MIISPSSLWDLRVILFFVMVVSTGNPDPSGQTLPISDSVSNSSPLLQGTGGGVCVGGLVNGPVLSTSRSSASKGLGSDPVSDLALLLQGSDPHSRELTQPWFSEVILLELGTITA